MKKQVTFSQDCFANHKMRNPYSQMSQKSDKPLSKKELKKLEDKEQ